MLEIIKAIIFGIIEGITEWLPISSTGHMILLNEIMPLKVSSEFLDMFLVVIQLGAIFAVVLIYWNKLFPFNFKSKEIMKKDVWSMWFKVVVACIPAVAVELLWGDKVEEVFYNYKTVACMLIVVGIIFILVENYNKGKKPVIKSIGQLSYKTALYIGLFQVVAAVFPGTSRSGATIIGALMLGVSRVVATEFTFFMSVPVMFGASLMKLMKFGFNFSGSELAMLIIGMVVAFVVSIIAIRFLMGYIKKNDFKAFGWYRIVLGVVVIIYFLLR